ncbi:DNA replication/repair protein RecF [Haliea sp. E1-2-M8]|uniref:DNA replication/repair protein RecF n=1 Tax=Haliea sp. E1-2-M8 TaxID=3064706 RepID=UPI002721D9FB|nr:DNA replication/repair protein RecF [Haliea sp. E1-2-M8]MDO8860101.1 DNA replication/repair protein RecF [Haliea sp. E1-2-M8]
MLTQLQIHHVRNLQQVTLQDLSRINIFFGANGSGKTSVLESVHMLGMARSFRQGATRTLIQHGQRDCTVYGMTADTGTGSASRVPVAVQRTLTGEVQIKLGGQTIRSVAELVEHLPLQVLNAASFELLTGAPAARRQFLNWGVFHVEQRFFAEWQRFQRCLKQRNKLLRHGKLDHSELSVWTRDLAKSGERIHEFRLQYFEALAPRFRTMMEQLSPSLGGLELRYRKGWDRSLNFSEALAASVQADTDQGYTHTGPQRADIKVTASGHSAAETLSRGQQKLVVCGLKLAQGQLMSQKRQGSCVYLVDDLPAELDARHCGLVCDALAGLQAQVFITCVAKADLEHMWPAGLKPALFHVERGAVVELRESEETPVPGQEGPDLVTGFMPLP